MKKGDAVYIKGTVTHAPQGDRTLYRVVTESEGSIVWCTPDEVVPREGEEHED